MEKPFIIAGIITYNPDCERIKENIEAILPQVDQVVLVDNHSKDQKMIRELEKRYQNVTVIYNPENRGVAAGLNQEFHFAQQKGAGWVLTLDQDTVAFSDLIQIYLPFMQDSEQVSLTCLRKERDFDEHLPNNGEPFQYVPKCITSGNIVRVSAWEKVGGFDEKLFIDEVDNDFCYRLRMAGFRILRVNKDGILHELGNGQRLWLFGHDFIVSNHNAFRKYYIYRNRTYLLRTNPLARQNDSWFKMFKHLVKLILYEDHKGEKLKACVRGIRDGRKM